MVVGFIGIAILVGFDPGVLAGTDVLAAVALIGSPSPTPPVGSTRGASRAAYGR